MSDSPSAPSTHIAAPGAASRDAMPSSAPLDQSSTSVAATADNEPTATTVKETKESSKAPLAETTEDSTPEARTPPLPAFDAALASDNPTEAPSESEAELKAPPSPPQITPTSTTLTITVLVQSGARHRFVVDPGFLERHLVKSGTGKEMLRDPFDMSVWQLKECIWKDWKEDWDQRPASALFIKLIQFGAYLNDSNPLRDCRFNVDTSNVVHMVIRPAEVNDDDVTQKSTKGAFSHSRDRDTRRTPSCRCVIL